MMKRTIAILLLGFSFASFSNQADAQSQNNLAMSLRQAAKQSISYCKENQLGSVGVLKFLVVKDGGDFSDNVGTLNTLLAKRLEIALVLANDPRAPITLIENASAVAAKTPGANHLSKDGRQAILSAEYPVMWGDEKVKPDAMVTGVAEVSEDMTKLTISLLAFDKNTGDLAPIGNDLTAAITPQLLTEVGESFSTRGAFDGGKITKVNSQNPPSDLPDDSDSGLNNQTALALTSVKKIRDEKTAIHPLVDPAACVRLEIAYDGKLMPFDIRDGKALLREPKQGQRVEIFLTKDKTPARYGVVVKVNGQNTLNKQQLPDARCRKWVLAQPGGRFMLKGFQVTNQELELFRVLSKSESKAREIDYGSDVGTLSISVFPEGKTPGLELDDDKHEAKIVEAAKLPKEPSKNFNSLKAKLLADANRGLIAEGNKVAGKINVVKFVASQTPVMTATATYYKP